MAIGLILGAAAQIQAGAGQDLGQGYELKRNGYGQGEALYQMDVEGLEADPVSLDIRLSERIYTKEEAYKTYESVMENLPRYILGENESLAEVRSSLNLVTSLNQYGIRLRWESDQPGLVDSYGQVNNTEVEEAGREVCLSVRMTDGTWPEEFIIGVVVKPPLLTEEEIRQAVRDTMDRLAPGGGFCWCGGYLGAIDDPEVIRKNGILFDEVFRYGDAFYKK